MGKQPAAMKAACVRSRTAGILSSIRCVKLYVARDIHIDARAQSTPRASVECGSVGQ